MKKVVCRHMHEGITMVQNIFSNTVLNNGVNMPAFGLGLFRIQDKQEMEYAIKWAVEIGYRLFDTAAFYDNEESVGNAIATCGVPRESLFVSTKIWPTEFDKPQKAIERSLKQLKMDYIDLFLIHWPGTDEDKRLKVWDAMQEQMLKGRIRACGVSNFLESHLQHLQKHTGTLPSNNQIELHPWQQQRDVTAYCKNNNISVTAWAPLFHGHLSEVPLMQKIGSSHHKTAAQATLRWHIQQGINIIPKSIKKSRLTENADIFDFTLTDEEMIEIDNLDGKGKQFAYDPNTYNGETEI